MTHLRIEQNNNVELVNSRIIHSLYIYATSNQLDSESNLCGNLYTNVAKRSECVTLMSLYRNLNITAGEYYLDFEDPVVERICAQNWGDGIGITADQANSVTSVGNAFEGNTEITTFDELSYFGNLIQFNYTYANNAFTNCSNLTSVDLINMKHNNTSRNFSSLFKGCSNLEVVKNFNGICIGISMFHNCVKLREIDLSSVTQICEYGLSGCASLDVTSNGLDFTQVTKIEKNAFVGVLGVGDVQLPSCTSSIDHAFCGCNSIISLSNCPNITNIGGADNYNGSFDNCANLDTLDFSSSTKVQTLRRSAIVRCPALRIIKLPQSIVEMQALCLVQCNNPSIVLYAVTPPSLVEGQKEQFSWNSISFSKIYVPDESVETYKYAAGWTEIADKIYSISQFAIDFPNE